MQTPGLEATLTFLRGSSAFPDATAPPLVRETHMSWVFLTGRKAYKLKKPVRNDFVDHRSLEARRRTCELEVRLNRRLAPDVYLGLVPVTLSSEGRLALGGHGEVVEWLVQMRRLADELMLDRAIAAQTVADDAPGRLGGLLARFYRAAPLAAAPLHSYAERLRREVVCNREELARGEYGLPVGALAAAVQAQLAFLRDWPQRLEERLDRVVEAHGDLRPEHVCLEPTPVIIDCLEFSRDLRVLDAASELAFLWLECERLGAGRVGREIFEAYCRRSGDRPGPELMAFYRGWHACVRARIAVWHLKDAGRGDASKWIARGADYLRLAAEGCGPLRCPPARRPIPPCAAAGWPPQKGGRYPG